jgi:hypothetical protein
MPGDAACISRYIGKSDAFCEAITNFAIAYAEQTESDYRALKEAVKSCCIKAKKGLRGLINSFSTNINFQSAINQVFVYFM